jgi:hypothetical protein
MTEMKEKPTTMIVAGFFVDKNGPIWYHLQSVFYTEP